MFEQILKTMNEQIDLVVSQLNKEYPNWKDKICLDLFDMESMSQCILGQVFGYWGDGPEDLKDSPAVCSVKFKGFLKKEHDFDYTLYVQNPKFYREFIEYTLQTEWEKRLRRELNLK
jgi:hypothetical protein